jgi:DNA-binding transcriptional LysR family regulator
MRDENDEDGGRSSRPSVRELEVLHAVITTRKTTAAAQRLGVSQPAVSRAIGALEARLGRDLFVRDGGRLVPTADAYALDAEAAPIFAALARLDNWPKTPNAGSLLRIVSAPTITHAFLAPLIVRFLQAEPDTRIQMEIGRSNDAVAAVADGTADLGVVDVGVVHAGVRAEPFRQSVAHVMMPADHPLTEKEGGARRRSRRGADGRHDPPLLGEGPGSSGPSRTRASSRASSSRPAPCNSSPRP